MNDVEEKNISYKKLLEIKEYNALDDFVLRGQFNSNTNFGFMHNVLTLDGRKVYYPNGFDLIDSVYVGNIKGLKDESYYDFEFELANIDEQSKHGNPYLIQTSGSRILALIKHGELHEQIIEKEKIIKSLNNNINKLQLEYEELLKQRPVGYEDLQYINELQDKINNIENLHKKNIQEQNEFISGLVKEIDDLEHIKKNKISEISNLKMKIEKLLQKIELLRKLELADENTLLRLNNLGKGKFERKPEWLDFQTDLNSNFTLLADKIQAYLKYCKNLEYTSFQIRNFFALLETNDIIILSGLSGSGKTQIIKAVAEAIGGVSKIIPVKPNWLSSDDLLGFYNPIQNCFMPTPFTEAILEARDNPYQMYFICLDEMNLARAEYYFADFLSQLEEREKQPEIDLFAQEEEFSILSELANYLKLAEDAIGTIEIRNLSEFLENDEIRTKFLSWLGGKDKDSTLATHSKIIKSLRVAIKYRAKLEIPQNVRFIGAINVDETTHYFSPKILDRVHIVRFDNPLKLDSQKIKEQIKITKEEAKVVYLSPEHFTRRNPYPAIDNELPLYKLLREISTNYLDKLGIDFGIRSIRQSMNVNVVYEKYFKETEISDEEYISIILNILMMQKILTRFSFDADEKISEDQTKGDVLNNLLEFLKDAMSAIIENYDETILGPNSLYFLEKLGNKGYINFWKK